MDTRQIAQTLMSYFLKETAEDTTFKIQLEDTDNEIKIQVLLSIYQEMHNIWYACPSMSETRFLRILNKSFRAIQYDINIISPDDLVSLNGVDTSDIVFYATITSDNQLLRSPFHPFHICSIAPSDNPLPESYMNLFTNPEQLPLIASKHIYSNGKYDILTFNPCV